MSFLNPQALWLLWILAPLFLAMLLSHRRAKRALNNFADPDMIEVVLKRRRWLPWARDIMRLAAVGVLIFALSGPGTAPPLSVKFKSGDGIWILLDLSRSMGVGDIGDGGKDRLTRAKEIIRKLVEDMGPRPISLITFSGPAYMRMPLTVDYSALIMLVDDLQTGEIFGGTDVATALRELVKAAEKAKRGGIIILISDGENNRGKSPVHAVTYALEHGLPTNVIGVGTRKGGKIPVSTAESTPRYLMGSRSPIYSRRDEPMLKSIARAGSGIYVDGNEPKNVDILISKLKDISTVVAEPKSGPNRKTDFLQVLLVFGAGLVAFEGFCWWVL